MTSYREMSELAKDPARVQMIATELLAFYSPELTDWEVDFLHDMRQFVGPDPLSTRQREKLVEIRDDIERHTQVDGFSVASLIKSCWQARQDLGSDDDIEFLEKIEGKTSLRRSEIRRLLHCARELGVIERYVRFDD